MFRLIILFSFLWLCEFAHAQNTVTQDTLANTTDLNYREDQFYLGITYNLLNDMPSGMSQNGFSSGFHFGFIRDFPVNERRNVAFGVGLGYSVNSINQNLLIARNNQGDLQYSILDESMFSKNKMILHIVELPIEFRWRTSTPTEYNFWRIYTGLKLGYVFSSVAKFKGEPNDLKEKPLDDLNKLQYGFTLSAGYDQFNLHIYYALNTLFDDTAKLEDQPLDLSLIKIGLIIYIL